MKKSLIWGHYLCKVGEPRLSEYCLPLMQAALALLPGQTASICAWQQTASPPALGECVCPSGTVRCSQATERCHGQLPLSTFPCLLPCSWSIYELHSQVPQQQQQQQQVTGGGRHQKGNSSAVSVVCYFSWGAHSVLTSCRYCKNRSQEQYLRRMRLQLWNRGVFPLSL